jgi:uncharacterized protein YjbJ (UPF0337 family)
LIVLESEESTYEHGSGRRKLETGERKNPATVGKLTEDDLDVIEGKAEELVGRVQERYGIAREEAEKQVAKFRSTR